MPENNEKFQFDSLVWGSLTLAPISKLYLITLSRRCLGWSLLTKVLHSYNLPHMEKAFHGKCDRILHVCTNSEYRG